jgi:hypothetical protein
VLPPLEFDHPFKGKLVIKSTSSPTEIKMSCDASTFSYQLGCALRRNDGCYILMRDETYIRQTGWTTEIVFRHEIGHCNGWPGDHRGARQP